MQGIYNYIPETNHVSTVHSVAAVLYLQFVLHAILFLPLIMFCAFILALSIVCVCVCVCVCVQCPVRLLFAVP
jgi:hypothetical protein